jgi:hypothetical protein
MVKTKKSIGRREFVKDMLISTIFGAGIGTGTYLIGDSIKSLISNKAKQAEREIRELALDVRELSGALEERLATERERLQTHYKTGLLNVYTELGIATPTEASEIEKIIETYEDFENHYNFSERARIYKDRIDKRLLNVDSKLEKAQPDFVKGINDKIRGLFGKPKEEKGEEHRKAILERLERLSKIYDTNSDNREAQGEVLQNINDYLEDKKLSEEERNLYSFLKEQCDGEGKDLRHFIQNYESYGERQDIFLNLRKQLEESERIYARIKEDKVYIERLQGILKDGISLKESLRKRLPEEIEEYKAQYDSEIKRLRQSVDVVIDELESKGYDVETREEFIKSGPISKYIDNTLDHAVKAGSVITGGLAWLVSFKNRKKTRKLRSITKSYEALQKEHAALLEKLNNEKDTEKLAGDEYEN